MSRMPEFGTIAETAPDGTVERHGEEVVVRYRRRLNHPPERVWQALTDPAQFRAWWGEVELEPRPGGRFVVRWLNRDLDGNTAVMRATIARWEPPTLLETVGDIHGTLRWELRPIGGGAATELAFSSTLELPEAQRAMVLAGWHVHLDFLGEALAGERVDWANWPFGRWQTHHERYLRRIG